MFFTLVRVIFRFIFLLVKCNIHNIIIVIVIKNLHRILITGKIIGAMLGLVLNRHSNMSLNNFFDT